MLSPQFSYDRANPTVLEGTAEPYTKSTVSYLQEITAVARTLAIGLNRKRLKEFQLNNWVSHINLSNFEVPVSREYVSQIQNHSDRRWQEFFKSERSYNELDINSEKKFARTIALKNENLEFEKSTDGYILQTQHLTPQLSFSIQDLSQTNTAPEKAEVQEVHISNIHNQDSYDITITVKPETNLDLSFQRDITPSTIVDYAKESKNYKILNPLFKQYLSKSQHRDIVLFISTDRPVATIPLVNSNTFPIVKAVSQLYNSNLTILPSHQTFVLTSTKEKTKEAQKLKNKVESEALSEQEFNYHFGKLLDYELTTIESYRDLTSKNINPKTAYLEKKKQFIGKELSEKDLHMLELIPYIPKPVKKSILKGVTIGEKHYNQLQDTKLGQTFLQERWESKYMNNPVV